MHPLEEIKRGSPERSPSLTKETLPSLIVATMDFDVKDTVLPNQATKAIKVPTNLIDNTHKTRQFATVKRKARKKSLADQNSCKMA